MSETIVEVSLPTTLLQLGIDRATVQQRVTEWLVLARELNADWVLMDEKKGRRKLSELKLNKINTIGILLKAKNAGLIA